MKFCVIYQQTSHTAQSPVRVVEQSTGREVGWINRYLDREYVRRLANTSLRIYAHNLLHFVRWWEIAHHTGDVKEGDLIESTLLDYVKFQSSQQPRPSSSTINDRVAVTERALRNEFPAAPCQIAYGFHHAFLQRKPMGLGRPRVATSRLRVKVPKRNIVPLSVEEVARFWCEFPYFARLGHRGLDVARRAAVRRSIGFESRRRVAFRSTTSRSRQRQEISSLAAGAGNCAAARTLPAIGTAQSLFRRALRLNQRTRARNTHDRCGITFLIPLPSPGHRHPARQPSSISPHLCFGHDPRGYEPARTHATDGSRRHPDNAALCASHSTRRLP